MSDRPLARPIFASEDFGLLRDVVDYYLQQTDACTGDKAKKFVNLRHRLNALTPQASPATVTAAKSSA